MKCHRALRTCRAAAALTVLLALWRAASPVAAITGTWNQTDPGTGYVWGVPANWLNLGVPNGIGDVASLNINALGGSQTISLGQVVTLGTLNLGDPGGAYGFTLAAGSGGYLVFDVASGMAAIQKTGAAADVISTGIQFNDPFSIANAGAGLLTLSGGLRSVSSNLTFEGTGNATVQTTGISTAGDLVKNGSGVLTLAIGTTYAGATTVNDGTLVLTSSTSLPVRSAVTVGATGTFEVQNAFTIGSLSGSGLVTNTSGTSRILTVGRDDTSTIFSGRIAPATTARVALTKIGAGTLTLQPTGTNASTYTGNTVINGGAISLDTSASSLTSGFLGATPLQITGGNFQMLGRSGATVSQTLGAFTLGATGGSITLVPNGGTATNLATGAVTASTSGGALLINAPASTEFKIGTAIAATALNGRMVFHDGSANTYNWAWNNNAAANPMSGFTGYSALPAAGPGAANTAYDLTASQTQTGATTIGTLKLSSTAGSAQTLDLGAGALNMTLGGSTTSTPGAILIDGTAAWNINSSGTGVLGQATVAGGDLIFQQYNTANGVTVNAGIANGAGPLNLVKAGPGLLTLAGPNTFTGTVFVDGGTLSFSSLTAGGAGSLGNGSTTAVTIRDGATLQYTGPTGTLSGAATTAGAHTFALQGGNATIEVTSATASLELNGIISGAGGLTKTGPAGSILRLNAANTYSGPTFISGGTLQATSANSIPDLSPVTVGASGTLDINGTASSQTETVGSIAGAGTILNSNTAAKTLAVGGDNTSTTFAGTFGAGGVAGNILTKTGSGILTLANPATSAWTGGNNVNGGVLRLATNNALSSTGTMNLSLAAGPAQLELNPGVSQTLAALTIYGTGTVSTSQGNVLLGSGAALTLGGNVTVNNTGNPLGAVIAGTGSLVLSSTRTFDTRDSAAVPAGAAELLVSAPITGAGGLTKTGPGTLLLTAANTFAGPTTFSLGSLVLDYSVDNSSKLGTSALATGGGTLVLTGSSTAATTQTVTGTTASAGSSTVLLNSGGGAQPVTLAFGAFTRTGGSHTGTVRLLPPAAGGFTTSSANVNGILGGWLTMTAGGSTGFVTSDGSGNILPFASNPADAVGLWTANDNVTDSGGFAGTAPGPVFSINSIRFDAAAATSVVGIGDNQVLRVASGGILETSNAGSGASRSFSGGYLVSGVSNELIVTQDNTGADLEINSRLIGATAVTKSGTGRLVLSGTNAFTGTATLQAGTLQVTGGSAFGDSAALVLVNDPANPTFDLVSGQNETIGNLSGGGTYGGTVSVGAGSTLTVNQTASQTFSGYFTGSGSLVKSGAGGLTLDAASTGFTGAVSVNHGRLTLTNTFGAIANAPSFTVSGAELLIAQNQTGAVNRVGDTTLVQLNNTAGAVGLQVSTNQNASREETIGSIALNAGQNVVTLDATGSSSSSLARLRVASNPGLTRSNNATALVRGRNLGTSSTTVQRTELTFLTTPAGQIGGGGAAGTATISIYPYLIGESSTASVVASNLGNSFVTYGANGIRPLLTTSGAGAEYIFNAAGYDAMPASTANNVRFTATPGATLGAAAGGTRTINALAIDSTSGGVAITGPGSDALVLSAGALLSTGPNASSLAGYGGIGTGTGEYVIFTTDGNQFTLGSPLTTAGAMLTKAGAGSLLLNGVSSSYAGGTWINEGAIEADSLANLGSGGLNFFGGALRWAAGATFDASSRTVTFGTGGATLDTNGNNVTFAGSVGNGGAGGLTKSGNGTLLLQSAANWSGGISVTKGTLAAGANNALSAGDLSVTGGATLDLQDTAQTVANLTLGAGSGNVVADTGPGTGTLTVNGTANLNQGAVAPVLAGSMNLVKSTASQTVTMANANNTFTGYTWIQDGTLAVTSLSNAGVSGSLGAPTGNNAGILIGSGASSNATLQYTGAGPASSNRPILLAGTTGGGAIDSDAGGLLTWNGGAYGVVAGAKSLILQGSNGSATAPNVFAGIIEDGNAVVGLAKAGSGVWELSAANTFTGPVAVNGGRLQVTGSVSNSPVSGGGSTTIGNVADSQAVLHVSGPTYNTNTLAIANGGGAGLGVLVINGGAVAAVSTASQAGTTMAASASGSAYAGLFLSSGSFATQRLDMGANASTPGTGIVQITGGTFNWSEYLLGRAGRWEVTVNGGNAIRTGTGNVLALGQATGAGAMTIASGIVDNSGQDVAFGRSVTGGTSSIASLNLNAGGTLVTRAFVVTPANFASGAAYLNFNGGTLRADSDSTAFLPAGLTGVYVNAGGAIIDSNGRNITVAASLLAPAGNGVGSIAVTDGGSGYLGAPYVEITGGGGSGATASATVDLNPSSPTYGKLTGIAITNPGNNYTSTPAINLVGGLGAGGTAATLGAITTPMNSSGGLTKNGLGSLTLSGVTLDYTGATVVNAGTLSITGSTGSAPLTSGVTVAGGAALNLFNTVGQPMNSLSVLSLGAGSGTATLGLELGATSDSLGTANLASVANSVHFNLSPVTGFGIGSYTLLAGGSGSALHTGASYSYGGLPQGYSYSHALSDTAVVLNVAAGSANPALYWRGAVNGQWGGYNGSFQSNWTTDLAGTINAGASPDPSSSVTFSTSDQTLAGPLVTTLDTPYTINRLVFNGEMGTGPISGITIAPGTAGSLTISPSVATDGIRLEAGAPPAVTISAPLTLGALQTWTVTDSGSVLALSGIVSGGSPNSSQAAPNSNLSLTIKGAGAVDLASSGNTFTGDILVDGGLFRVDNLSDWGGPTVASSTSKTIALDNGGTLQITAGTINPGSVTTTSYKLVQIGSGGGVIDLATGATLILDDAGQLFGSGALTKSGPGTLSLRNHPAFGGTITATGGILQPSGGTGSNFGTTAAGTIIQSGAALNLNGINVAEPEPLTIAGAGLAANPAGAITNSSGTSVTFAGPITLAGHATIGAAAAGAMTLSGGITGAYDLTIRNLGAGATTLSTSSINNGGTLTNASTGTGAAVISAVIGSNVTGIVQNSATSGLTLSGNNSSFAGPITIKAGTLTANLNGIATTLGDGSATNTVTIGDSAGTSNATLVGVNSVTYLQNIEIAGGNTGLATIVAGNTTGSVNFGGALTLSNHDVILSKTGTTGASQFSGGITGTGNITIHNAATGAGTLSLTANPINPVGSITHTSSASGPTTVSADIGSNVTSITQNSASSVLTLSGASIAYTGATAVNAGTLNITGSAGSPLATSAVAVAGGATLNFVNSAGQALNSLSSLSLGSGSGIATLGLELGSSSDSLGTAAIATLANTLRFNITAISGYGAGSYTLLQGGAGSGFNSNAAYQFGAMPGGYAYSSTLSDTSVVLNVAAAAPTLYWLGGLGDGKWNSFSGSFDSNWASDLAGTANAKAIPGSATTVVFNTSNQTVAGTLATTLESPLSIQNLVFNGQLGTGPVSAIAIQAGAAGTLSIGSAATGIDVQAGAPSSITLAAPVILGASQAWDVEDSGTTLEFSPGAGGITDGGGGFSLTKTGAGRLLLSSASSTYTGGTILDAGTLAITGSGTDGSNTAVGLGTLRLNGGTFELASSSGSKVVHVPVEIAGNISFANTSTGATDALSLGKAVTLTGGTPEITVLASTSGPTIFSGAMGDGGNGYGIIKKGPGILALTGANTFTGDVRIDEGILRASGGTNRLGAGNLILGGGTLDINDSTGRDFNRPTTVTANSGIIAERATAGAGVTHGLGSLSIGGQTLTLSGGNVTSGTARLDFDATTFTGAPTFVLNKPAGGGTTQLTLGALDNQGFDLTVTGDGNLAQSGIWTGTGDITLHSSFTGTATLSQANTLSGEIVVKSGTLTGITSSDVFGTATLRLGDGSANPNDVLATTSISAAVFNNPVVLQSGTTGTITLRAFNTGSSTTYTGGFTGTNNLTLKADGGGALLLTSGAFDIAGAVTNAGAGSGAVTISSDITSNVTHIVQNSSTSTLNLSGSTIAFTGSTTVSAGTLNVTSPAGLPSGTSISVAGGATLNLVNGATQNLGSLAGLSLGTGSGTATLGLELGDTSNYDRLGVAGAATAGNIVRFNIAGLTGFETGNYDLLSAASGLTSGSPLYQVGSAPGGYTYSFSNTDALVRLVVATAAAGDILWRGDVDTSWSTYNAGDTNWVSDSGTEFGSSPGAGNKVIFSNAGATGPAISTTLDNHFAVDSLQFTAAPTGVTSVAIASGALPSHSLTIAPALPGDGIDVAANAGAITISAPVALGAAQEWDVSATAASLLVSGALSGSATLTKSGSGALTLSADNDLYSGGVTISGGTLNVGSGGATGTIGSGSIVNNGSLVFNRTGVFTVANLVSGTGALTKSGTGVMSLVNDANTFAGPLAVTGGTLNFTSIGTVGGGASAVGTPTSAAGGTITLGAGSVLSFTGSSNQTTDRLLTTTGSTTLSANGTGGATITFGGLISQATDNGLILTGSGAGFISGGILQNSTGTSADLTVNSGSWTIQTGNVAIDDDVVVNAGTLTLQGMTLSLTDDVVVGGAGAVLNLNSAGVLAAETVSGTSSFLYARSGGTINLGDNDIYGVGNSGGLDGIYLAESGGPLPGTLNMNSFNLFTPALQLGSYAAGLEGVLTGSGTITSGDWNIYRGTVAASLGGSALFEKLGLGTVTLSGNNSAFSGGATVQAGELVLDYSADNSAKLNSAALLTMNGGTLTVHGNAASNTNATFNGLTLNNGAQVIAVNSGGPAATATLQLGAITRNASGGTVRFLPPLPASGGITTTRTNANGILGGWATITDPVSGVTGFAANDGSNSVVLATSIARDNVLSWGAGENVTDSSGFTGTLCGAPNSPNSLRFGATGVSTVAIDPAATLTIGSGGVLMTSGAGGTATITGGTLASGTGNELIFMNDHSTHQLVIASAIAGSAIVTKSGAGTMVLSGTNTYTGATNLQQGTLILQGGNAIGDRSMVTISDDQNVTLQLTTDETIGGLTGGNANPLFASVVDLGSNSLTVLQAAGGTYSGTLSGNGTLIKGGAFNLALGAPNLNFTGALILNGASNSTGYFGMSGGGTIGATSVTVNKGAALLFDNNGTTRSGARLPDATPVTLNSADGIFQTTTANTIPRGLAFRTDQDSSTSNSETIGALNIASGASYASLEQQGGNSSRAIIQAANFVRTAGATLNIRGRALGSTAATGGQAQLKITDGTNESSFLATRVGGGGAAGTKLISIVPWAIGENTAGAIAAANMGNSLVSYVDNAGFRALDLAAEYNTFASKTSNQDNIRESLTGDLTGLAGQTINALVLHNANTAASTVSVAGAGAGQTLALTSGALLFTLNPAATASSAHALNLGGFDDGITVGSTNEYVVHVVNPSSDATTPTLSATISSPLNSTGAALVKSGRGTLILSGVNTYTGSTYLNEGVLQAGSLANLGNGGTIQLSGGTLRLASGFTDDLSTRTFNFTPSDGTLDVSLVTGGVTLTNGLDDATPYSGDLLGILTRSAASGTTGLLTIQGSSSYIGTTILNQAVNSSTVTSVLLNGNTNAAISGNLQIGNVTSGTLDVIVGLGANEQIVDTAVLSFVSGSGAEAYFKLFGRTETVAGISAASRGIVENFESATDQVAGQGSLIVNSSDDYSFTGYMRDRASGTGGTLAFTKQGSGMQSLTGANILYTGPTTISGGTLRLAGTTGFNSDITNNATLVLEQTTGTWTLGKTISGTGSLEKRGAGTVVLTGANSYSGVTSIHNGTLSIASSSALGSNTAGNNIDIHGNATLESTAAVVSLGANQNVALCGPVANISVSGAASNTLTIQGVVSGPAAAALEKEGTGTLILTGSNTYTGATIVNAGTLSISAEENLGANPGSFNAGQLTLNGGTLQTTASLSLNDPNRGVTLGAPGGTVLTNAGTTLGVENPVSGPGDLTKEGDGILLLNSAANTYAGSTSVNSGTLGGTGTVSGSGAVIGSGAVLAPGDPAASGGVGALNFASGTDLTFNGGSTWLVDVLQGSASDSLTGIDMFTVNGSVKLDLTFSGTWEMWQTYTLASYATRSGSGSFDIYSGLTDLDPDHDGMFLAGGGQYQVTFGDTSFTLQAVPEPEAWLSALAMLGVALLFSRRRRQRN